jgi:hypothetical protein
MLHAVFQSDSVKPVCAYSSLRTQPESCLYVWANTGFSNNPFDVNCHTHTKNGISFRIALIIHCACTWSWRAMCIYSIIIFCGYM